MTCPACREEMIVVEYKQIELDVCASCRGVWFDADELELLLGSLKLPAGQLVRPLREKSGEELRKCPYCRRKMEKVLIGPGEGELIDRCKNGHGLWFDGGELDSIIGGLRNTRPEAGVPAKPGGEVGSFLADVLLTDKTENEKGGQE
jgi:Zn-finger nucleic acid-binding protein